MRRAYKAKSLSGAERKVRDMQKVIDSLKDVIARFDAERVMLAKLAAKGPAFYNPLEAAAAEKIRDELLNQIGLNPDGSPK